MFVNIFTMFEDIISRCNICMPKNGVFTENINLHISSMYAKSFSTKNLADDSFSSNLQFAWDIFYWYYTCLRFNRKALRKSTSDQLDKEKMSGVFTIFYDSSSLSLRLFAISVISILLFLFHRTIPFTRSWRENVYNFYKRAVVLSSI